MNDIKKRDLLNTFRKELQKIEKKRRILSAETRKRMKTDGHTCTKLEDVASVLEEDRDPNVSRLAALDSQAKDISNNIKKVEAGTYGICEECGDEIPEKRLKANPGATLCVSCKSKHEGVSKNKSLGRRATRAGRVSE